MQRFPLFPVPALFLLLALPAFAQRSDEDGNIPPPPPATSKATWLFSWTKKPLALTDARGFVSGQLSYAQACVNKLAGAIRSGSEAEIKGCEGENMAAGPGIYACDNPFTSHDYGTTLVVMRSQNGDRNLVNASGLVAQASAGVDRSVYGDPAHDGILYDFRSNDFGGLAIAIRGDRLLDNAQTYSFAAQGGTAKEFHFHEPFACNSHSSIKDALSNWGDQMDFLSITFDSFRDFSGENFERKGQLNDAGIIAALASNVVAVPEAELSAKIAKLRKFSNIKEALGGSSCQEADHYNLKTCFAYELFDSITGNEGTNSHPTHAWAYPDLVKGLKALGILSATDGKKFKDQASLMKFLAARFQRDPAQLQRAQEAHGCMKIVKSQLEAGNLSAWNP